MVLHWCRVVLRAAGAERQHGAHLPVAGRRLQFQSCCCTQLRRVVRDGRSPVSATDRRQVQRPAESSAAAVQRRHETVPRRDTQSRRESL